MSDLKELLFSILNDEDENECDDIVNEKNVLTLLERNLYYYILSIYKEADEIEIEREVIINLDDTLKSLSNGSDILSNDDIIKALHGLSEKKLLVGVRYYKYISSYSYDEVDSTYKITLDTRSILESDGLTDLERVIYKFLVNKCLDTPDSNQDTRDFELKIEVDDFITALIDRYPLINHFEINPVLKNLCMRQIIFENKMHPMINSYTYHKNGEYVISINLSHLKLK